MCVCMCVIVSQCVCLSLTMCVCLSHSVCVSPRTHTDAIRELEVQFGILTERVTLLKDDFNGVRETQTDQLKLIHELSTQVAVLEDFKKRAEEKDRRSWLITAAVLGSLLTLAGNLLLFLLNRPS